MTTVNALLPYLTQDNITMVMCAFGYVIFAIRTLVKWTTTTKDDEILAKFDSKVEWVKSKAGYLYDIVQELEKSGAITKENKLAKFFDLLGDSYREAHKQEIPGILKTSAQVVVEAKNAIDKVKNVRDDVALQIEQVKSKLKGEIGPNDVAQEPGPYEQTR